MNPSHNNQTTKAVKTDEVRPPSSVWQNLLDVFLVWDMIWVIVAAAFGVGALLFAIFTLDVLAFAVALIAIPGTIIVGCMVKAMRDAGRDV